MSEPAETSSKSKSPLWRILTFPCTLWRKLRRRRKKDLAYRDDGVPVPVPVPVPEPVAMPLPPTAISHTPYGAVENASPRYGYQPPQWQAYPYDPSTPVSEGRHVYLVKGNERPRPMKPYNYEYGPELQYS